VQFLGEARFERRDGATLRYATPQGVVEITVCAPRIVRVQLASGDQRAIGFVEPRRWAETPFTVQSGSPSVITTDSLAVSVDTRPFRLALGRPNGDAVLREIGLATGGRDGAGQRVQVWLTPSGEQHFSGLGHGGSRLDRLGETRQFWNSHVDRGPGSDIGIPLLVSNRGYALFFDNPSDARLIPFGAVPPVVYSEVMGDLKRIAGKAVDRAPEEA